jgi:AcrR family transcriptional regulator
VSTARSYVSPKREAGVAATRQAILMAFRDQLLEGDRDTLSPTDAAERAGCSVRTVHGHFPTKESRVEALAEWLDEHLYPEPLRLPTSIEELPDHYRSIHRAALKSPLTTALVAQSGSEWREVRAARRADRLDAIRRVVDSIHAPVGATADATAVLLTLAGAEITMIMRDEVGLDQERIPDAIAHMVELIVEDLRATARP